MNQTDAAVSAAAATVEVMGIAWLRLIDFAKCRGHKRKKGATATRRNSILSGQPLASALAGSSPFKCS